MRDVNVYMMYDVLAEDVMNIFYCPSDNAALLGFANAKKGLEEKGYNPRLVQLYKLSSHKIESSNGHLLVSPSDVRPGLMCDLINAPVELDRITRELLDKDVLTVD